MGPMKLSLFLLQFKLHLLNVFLHALHLKVIALKFALDLALGAALLLQVLGELDEHFVFLELDGVTFTPQLCGLGQQLLLLALMSVQIPPQLSDKLTVFLVVSPRLEGLVLYQELAALLSGLLLHLGDLLLKFMPLSVQLHLDDIELALCFIVLFAKAVHLVLLGVQLNPVSALNVFLNLHAHDIGVDGQGHLIRHRIDLSLLLFDGPSHVIEAFLDSQLELLLRLDLLGETLLELVRLAAHLLVVRLEVGVKRTDLLFLADGGLQVALHCAKGPL